MNRMAAGVIAVLLVIACAFGGMLAGATIGNLIVPANLTWSGDPGPGLMLIGAFLGLVAGFGFGTWAAMRVVDEAKVEPGAAVRARRGSPAAARTGSRILDRRRYVGSTGIRSSCGSSTKCSVAVAR